MHERQTAADSICDKMIRIQNTFLCSKVPSVIKLVIETVCMEIFYTGTFSLCNTRTKAEVYHINSKCNIILFTNNQKMHNRESSHSSTFLQKISITQMF